VLVACVLNIIVKGEGLLKVMYKQLHTLIKW